MLSPKVMAVEELRLSERLGPAAYQMQGIWLGSSRCQPVALCLLQMLAGKHVRVVLFLVKARNRNLIMKNREWNIQTGYIQISALPLADYI